MRGRFVSAVMAGAVLALLAPASLTAQEIERLSREIGGIERGFWTRPLRNHLAVEAGDLIIRRSYTTVVEWTAPGVPGRAVTDLLEWRLPLADLRRVDLAPAPGSLLLEGSDQDSYCPLTVARFTCAHEEGDCGASPSFAVCRYHEGDLRALLEALQAQAPNLTIAAAE